MQCAFVQTVDEVKSNRLRLTLAYKTTHCIQFECDKEKTMHLMKNKTIDERPTIVERTLRQGKRIKQTTTKTTVGIEEEYHS